VFQQSNTYALRLRFRRSFGVWPALPAFFGQALGMSALSFGWDSVKFPVGCARIVTLFFKFFIL